ncbi:MAG: hypothetical protein V4514_23860 [Pseudomonadota bacterium]
MPQGAGQAGGCRARLLLDARPALVPQAAGREEPGEDAIAAETIAIRQLYAVEAEIRSRTADERRVVRQEKSAPILPT